MMMDLLKMMVIKTLWTIKHDGCKRVAYLLSTAKGATAQPLYNIRKSVGADYDDYLKAAREATGLPIVTEIMSADKIERFVEDVDLIQVGARNMQNFELLKELGKTNKPILLKRGLAATIEEWIMSAEYIMAGGNDNVILCERGIRTFEHYTRNTLDLSAIPAVKKLSHLHILVARSHSFGACGSCAHTLEYHVAWQEL